MTENLTLLLTTYQTNFTLKSGIVFKIRIQLRNLDQNPSFKFWLDLGKDILTKPLSYSLIINKVSNNLSHYVCVYDFCSPFLVGNVGGIFGMEKVRL